MFRHLHIAMLVATVALGACSETPGETENCPEGSTRSPVTGTCESDENSADAGGEDLGSSPADQGTTASSDTGAGDQGSATTADAGPTKEDLGTTPTDDMGAPPETVVRFVAIGDQGTGSDDQRLVGQSIGTVCGRLGGCDFGLLLGDNVYQSGVDSVDDSLFISHFVDPYGHLGFPFWVALGNHDLGGDGLGVDIDFQKAEYQVGYSELNPQWQMPAEYYTFDVGNSFFVGLNTTDIFFGQDDDQRADIPTWLTQTNAAWKIAFGHHPYLSNGPHGNAGDYEGTPFIPVVNGANVKDFMEDVVCGNFDFYLCGHDHSRQDLVDTCSGTQLIVSGAGAKTTDLEGDNPTHFESDTIGFLVMEARPTSMTIRFYDGDGTLEHERVVTR